jgi:hypothetical protein
VAAQEAVKPMMSQKDSVIRGLKPGATAPLLFQPPLIPAGLNFELQDLPAFTPKITAPVFDLSAYMKNRWVVTYNSGNGLPVFPSGSFFTPVWGTLFNQAVFQASDKLKIGGNSFGVNSLLHAPLPSGNGGNYDYRGVSVFMEYKVTNNFRIGGSISVAGHPNQP